jgi:hypothetical protein
MISSIALFHLTLSICESQLRESFSQRLKQPLVIMEQSLKMLFVLLL